MLDSGGYRVELPEQAALLTVAWLLRAGDRARALGLLDEIGAFGGQLCFAPAPDRAAGREASVVWREPAGEVGEALRRRRENARVEAMRETLMVWNPLADELLDLWLETRDGDGRIASAFPPGWHERAEELMARYWRLATLHTRCGKHRRPKENLAILRMAVQETLAGRQLTPRARGLLRHAVEAMLARRGHPGSPEHAALRATQARVASIPGYHQLARVVVARLAAHDPDAGIADVNAICAPVTTVEAAAHAVPAGTAIPKPIRRVVQRATAGTVPELIGTGVVPSAEVLAELVPQIAATISAAAYPDPALRDPGRRHVPRVPAPTLAATARSAAPGTAERAAVGASGGPIPGSEPGQPSGSPRNAAPPGRAGPGRIPGHAATQPIGARTGCARPGGR
jgi:hypothetical protein